MCSSGQSPRRYFCRDWPRFVTELQQSNVSSVTRGAIDEFGMAGTLRFALRFALKFPCLVKSPGLVVEFVDVGQRRQYRGLVPAVPKAARTADRRSRQHIRHRAHAPPVCGLCFWLRIQVVPAARGRAADLLVRYL